MELADTPFPVALIQRFDRRGVARIPYISARTALGKTGVELGSYTEIVDFMRSYSPDPSGDFRELYRRLIFTILVSNKDDHLKNHGFLYVGAGQWRLSPVSGTPGNGRGAGTHMRRAQTGWEFVMPPSISAGQDKYWTL